MIEQKSLWPITLLKCAVIVIAGLLLYVAIDYLADRELSAVARRATAMQKRLIALEQENFKTAADNIAALIVDDETLRWMDRLKKGELSADAVRKRLLKKYRPVYERLRKNELRHLQFHLPDGTSLLRVHRPKKYGDSLLAIRPSVAKVIETRKPLYGFEIGRYLGAYRAVYPLFYRDDYVGSVEFSFTFCVMKRQLERISAQKSRYYLALELGRLKKSAEWNQLYVYRQCYVDPRFVVNEKVIAGCRILKEAGLRLAMLPYREFTKILEAVGKFYIVSFIPLSAIDGSHVGYYVVVQEDPGSVQSINAMAQIGRIAVVLVVLVGLLLVLMIHFYRVRAHAANIDPLTGVYNRRGCMRELGNGGKRYALIFIDVDRFKEINDTYGHDKGDEVLRTIARIIATHIRKEDVFCRYGGDEFLVFIANASMEQAKVVAEKLRKHVAIHRFEGVEDVTVSVGIAIRHKNESIGSLIARADKSLFKAKGEGRNRVAGEE